MDVGIVAELPSAAQLAADAADAASLPTLAPPSDDTQRELQALAEEAAKNKAARLEREARERQQRAREVFGANVIAQLDDEERL